MAWGMQCPCDMDNTLTSPAVGSSRATFACTFDWTAIVNPRWHSLTVSFALQFPARVRLSLNALSGGTVKVLFDAPRGAGSFIEKWAMVDRAARTLAPGLYMVSLELDGELVAETSVFQS